MPRTRPTNSQPSLELDPPSASVSLTATAPQTTQLSPVLEANLRNVSGAIINKPPLCSGTWEIPPESFQLFFKKGDDSGCVKKKKKKKTKKKMARLAKRVRGTTRIACQCMHSSNIRSGQ
jgi:hypothetical protein